MAGDDRQVPGRIRGADDVQIRTFLIADVRGYTVFTQERGDEAAAKLAGKFADIAREGVEARDGTLLELRGDEALCVFSSARQAIRAAVELQTRFVEETIDQPELPLTVGIGLDAGEAVPVQGGYRGGALNLAARLCGQAVAGEILASREVTHLARSVEGVRYEDRGTISLKGLADPVSVVRVASEDLDTVERLRPFGPPPPPAPRTSKGWAVAIGVALVLALVAISVPLLSGGDDEPLNIGSNSMALMNAEDGSLEFATALGQRPGASATGLGSVWVTQPDRGVVARLDLDDGSVVHPGIEVGTSPAGIAVGEGSVWVTNAGDATVSRIAVGSNEVSQTLDAGSGPSGIAVGNGALWIADTIGAQLLRVDPTSGETQAVALPGQPSGVAFTPDGVWVSFAPAGIARIDPANPSVTLTQTVGTGPAAVLAAYGSIWVANHIDGTVSRLDPSTGRVQTTVDVGEGPSALAAAAGSLWVANEFDGSIAAIDPSTNTVVRTVSVGGAAASLAVEGDGLWLAVGASPDEHRGGTLTVSSPETELTTFDPTFANDSITWQILSITNDGLLAFRKVGGPDGATLVPDLASAFPEVSADGLTYRFPLRDGIRYSTGELVRAEDFRRALERTLASVDWAYLYGAIDGADACADDPPTCDLSESIVVEEGAVTLHLARPDPDLPFKLALPPAFPVPAATPFEDQGLAPAPATGPYMVSETDANGFELVRNPEFREWSGAAQPDGFVDAISWRFGEGLPAAFDQLSAGELDWMTNPPSPEDLVQLQTTHPDQVVVSRLPATFYVGFHLSTPPFDDARVRQAINYAIDRDHVVDLLGGPTSHRPACQILPPNFQGYEPFCPYTLEPSSGVWSAPDLDRARGLIEDAGAIGERATVWVSDADLPGGVEAMRYVVEVMNELGLRATLKVAHDLDRYVGVVYGGKAPAFLFGWLSSYPGAGDFIPPQFLCGEGANALDLCDPELDAAIHEAQRLQASDPAAANSAWIAIEHQLVEDGVWAPLANLVATYAFSARTENIQDHPQWGILLSRLWVQ